MTNDKGEVVFEAVPAGRYSLVFNAGGRWTIGHGKGIDIDGAKPLHALGKLVFGR